MRYHHTSWNDVDRALEAFKYARRSLLVVMAVALPFAAWETAAGVDTTARGDTVQVQPVQPVQQVQPVQPVRAVHPGKGGEPATLVVRARI
jgi:hypothetical protein